ncbi:MAG: endonuclease/exonuclease/phosphatase family protein [Bdellovibrionales bacterium]|nr:endonuclease/exonuclease/phosphatase family protein [Bdellovibrionales bacterium]
MNSNGPSGRPSGRFSILTFNVWHGLAERGLLRFREFEEASRRRSRWQLALSEMQRYRPDVICLQELNPLSEKLSELVTALDGVATGCVDQGGVRLFSHGLPRNLVTELGILLREAARPVKDLEWPIPKNLQLSGAPFVSGESFSFHFNEIRRAQLEMIETARLGRVLIVNTHLHHGFERFAALRELLASYVSEGRISLATAEQLGLAMDQSRDRRLNEVDRLLEAVTQAERHCDGVLLAGDLNSPPEGSAVCALLQAGFRDLAEAAIQPDVGPTWDPVTNIENHDLQETFKFPLPTMGNPELQRLYRDFDRLPRRIDYVLGRGSVVTERPSRASRVGLAHGASLVPSDHYGVMVEWN